LSRNSQSNEKKGEVILGLAATLGEPLPRGGILDLPILETLNFILALLALFSLMLSKQLALELWLL
jgi:hypothetical protein